MAGTAEQRGQVPQEAAIEWSRHQIHRASVRIMGIIGEAGITATHLDLIATSRGGISYQFEQAGLLPNDLRTGIPNTHAELQVDGTYRLYEETWGPNTAMLGGYSLRYLTPLPEFPPGTDWYLLEDDTVRMLEAYAKLIKAGLKLKDIGMDGYPENPDYVRRPSPRPESNTSQGQP